tara:strand:- start:3160 stop:3519 length:360 start_codon:yes stop_codon:yes gene_type:complete
MKRIALTSGIIIGILFTLTSVNGVYAQDKIEHPDIVVTVNGLACPFCAYGLEKKLKKLEGVENIYIKIDEGIADIKLKENAKLSEDEIKKAVRNAGFTVVQIDYPNKKSKPNSGTDGIK